MSRKSKKQAQLLAKKQESEEVASQENLKDGGVADLPWVATKTALFLGGALLFGGAYWLLSNRTQLFGKEAKKPSKKPTAEKTGADAFYSDETSRASGESLSH